MMRAWISVPPAVVVLANTIPVHMAVPSDDVLTWIRLCPEALLFYPSRLGGIFGTFQAAKVFVGGGENFVFLQEGCIGGGEQGDCGRELLEHRLLVGGNMVQVIEINLDFLVLIGFSI